MMCFRQAATAKDKRVADATTFRLDTADFASELGWQHNYLTRFDEFSKDGVTIEVQYSRADEIESLRRSREGHDDERYDADSPGKGERLRIWLGIRNAARPKCSPTGVPSVPYGQERGGGCWTPESFFEAVEDAQDRAFLIRFLELVAANSVLPRQGTWLPLIFGKRPGGSMFVYPFGRRHPPCRFSVRQGLLMIAGCWSRFPKVKGHPGFRDLAAMLDLDETGPATDVPVAGLDAAQVWAVCETVSRAIN
jgi:hypothetical protein